MHAVLFYFLFRDFYNQAYNKKARRIAAEAEEKERLAALDKGAGNKGDSKDGGDDVNNGKHKKNGSSKNGSIYPSQYKMATAYISDSGLRNRVFIDNRTSYEEWFFPLHIFIF